MVASWGDYTEFEVEVFIGILKETWKLDEKAGWMALEQNILRDKCKRWNFLW